MREQYKKLFEAVEELKTKVEELENLEGESERMSREASEVIREVKAKYNKSVSDIQATIEEAEQENERNKKEVKELTRQQLVSGEAFRGADRLSFLSLEIAKHPNKIEALQKVFSEICINREEAEELDRFKAQEHQINADRRKHEKAILDLLANIKGDITTSCLACYDEYLMESRSRFIDDKYRETERMRREGTEA